MTKVSWKRILQRAGNDLPASGRPFADRPHVIPMPRTSRPVRVDDAPSVAGELESELRRALQRAQTTPGSDPKQPNWDPIFMAQELRHTEPVAPVPAAHYAQLQPRRSKTGRNLIAMTLSAAVVGLAIQQFGNVWRDSDGEGGGGGGNGGGGSQYENADKASLTAPIKAKDQVVQTGYAIQPMANAGSSADIGPVEDAPRSKAGILPQENQVDAGASFKRDMEEARKMFDRAEQAVPAARPAPAARSAPEPAPAQIAAVEPARVAPPRAAEPAPQPGIDADAEAKMMQRATDLMQRGDITGARLLFEHIARRGSAIGAFALGQSYDAKHLQKLQVRGLTPDQKQADFWYRRAAELGGPVAQNGKSRRQVN